AYSVDVTWSAVAFLFPGLRGGVIVEVGVKRRWPFRREGPNGSALLLEWQGVCRAEEAEEAGRVGGHRVEVGNTTPCPVAFWGPEAKSLGRFPPFPLSLLSPFPLFFEVERSPSRPSLVLELGGGAGGLWWSGGAARSEEVAAVLSPCSPPRECVILEFVATSGCRILTVCLPSDVATVVCIATLEEASPRSDATLSRRDRDGLGGRDKAWLASGVFRGRGWHVRMCPRAGLPLGPSGGNAEASCAGFCGGCPTSFSFARCSTLEGLSARQIVTVTWDPRSPHPTAVSITSSLVPFVVAPAGGRASGETFLLMWLFGVSRGDTWLFLPNLVEVQDVGACVVRLGSHVVAPVFRELLVSVGVCRGVVCLCLLEFLLLWLICGWRHDLRGSLAGVWE
ncbi:hypothetical protein Taro_048998, partial [Colocasia esculenta]|nr:hypothetical protein [Colocasia esculenta]